MMKNIISSRGPKKLFRSLLSGLFFFIQMHCSGVLWAHTDPITSHTQQDRILHFIANQNQWDAHVRYKAPLPGGALFLTGSGFTYNFYQAADLERIHNLKQARNAADPYEEPVRGHAYKVNFVGADTQSLIVPHGLEPFYHNYFLGNDPARWAGHVPLFKGVSYQQLYPGISLDVYSKGQSIKYDFNLAAGADYRQIVLQFEGVQPQLLPNGNLQIRTSVNELEEAAPYAYQVIAGKETQVPCRYLLDTEHQLLRFTFPKGYNNTYPLVIDPILVFGSYSGGAGVSFGFSATYDALGNLYAGAECFEVGWPTTTGAYQLKYKSGVDIGINKYNARGTALHYATYYGGASIDLPNNMIVNEQQELVICGATASRNLPVTPGCFAATNSNGYDLYVAHFNAQGSELIGATYIGGSDSDGVNTVALSPNYGDANRGEVFVDSAGYIYVAASTLSQNFPVTAGAYQTQSGGKQDGVFFKLNADCSQLLYSTYLGGAGHDACFSMVPDRKGNFVLVGGTQSANFPTTPGVLHAGLQGGTDGFITILNVKTGLIASTFLGTDQYDHAFKVQADASGRVYVLGQTDGNYPITNGVYHFKDGDIFIDEINPDLRSSLRSTRLGNRQDRQGLTGRFVPTAFMNDQCGKTYLCGYYVNHNLPVTSGALSDSTDLSSQVWLGVLEKDFDSLYFATYIPGANHVDGGTSRFDPRGIVYHSVCTRDLNFPTTANAFSPQKASNLNAYDCASFKFNFETMGVWAKFELDAQSVDSGCVPLTVGFHNTSADALTYYWDFGDGSPQSSLPDPKHTFTKPGVYKVQLFAFNPETCITQDTFEMKIRVFGADTPILRLEDTVVCHGQAVVLKVEVLNPGPGTTYAWEPPAAVIADGDKQSVKVNTAISKDFKVTVTHKDGACFSSSTAQAHIEVFDPLAFKILTPDTTICAGQSLLLQAAGDTSFQYQWTPQQDIADPFKPSTQATPGSTRTYRLTVTNGICVPEQMSVRVQVEPVPQVNVGADTVLCSYDTLQLFAAVQPASFSPYTYQWTPPDHLDSRASAHPVFKGGKSSNLVVTVRTPAGCSGRDTIQLTVYPGDFLEVTPGDTGYCQPGGIQLNAAGAMAYHWTPAYGLDNPTIGQPYAAPATPTLYTVTGKSNYGCIDSAQMFVDVYPNAVIRMPDTVFLWPGEQYVMIPESNAHYFSWFPPSGLSADHIANPIAAPEVRTRYFLTAITEQGCSVQDSIDVWVYEETVLDMPNAFHPGSGPNGILKLNKRGIAQLNYFRIYNRWGQVVYESKDIDQGWDGSYHEQVQPLGVYLYDIEVVTYKGKVWRKQGDVTLLR